VPTTAEGKYPNVTSDNGTAWSWPAATPADIQQRSTPGCGGATFAGVVENSRRWAASPARHAAGLRGFPRAEQAKWSRIVTAIGSGVKPKIYGIRTATR